MKISKPLVILILLFSEYLNGQTVVKMELAEQSVMPVQVETLFEEILPAGIPTAIGIMGFDIQGGSLPYVYHWIENDVVIAEGEVTVITPGSGKSYALKVIDKKNCSDVVPLSFGNTKSDGSDMSFNEDHQICTKFTRDVIIINPHPKSLTDTAVKIYDMKGRLLVDTSVSGETHIPVNLSPGVYLLFTGYLNSYNINKYVVH